jgi:RHS repeat-associated protein
LYHVQDGVAASNFNDDIDNQGLFTNTAQAINQNNNYAFDEIGNLKKDVQEQIASIEWMVTGKIKSITRVNGSTKKNLKFDYDAMGNRIAKHVYTSAGVYEKSTCYVRDAQGNVMSVYEQKTISTQLHFTQIEKHIYGSSRLGMDTRTIEMLAPPTTDTIQHVLGKRVYENSNHLGNVLAVVADYKLPIDQNADNTVDAYAATVVSTTDYYPFGVTQKERSFTAANNNFLYRYKFNGKELDDETETQDYGMRIYNAGLGRFLSVDPLYTTYPFKTVYDFAENSPIMGIDLDGGELEFYLAKAGVFGKTVQKVATGVDKSVTKFVMGIVTIGKLSTPLASKKEKDDFAAGLAATVLYTNVKLPSTVQKNVVKQMKKSNSTAVKAVGGAIEGLIAEDEKTNKAFKEGDVEKITETITDVVILIGTTLFGGEAAEVGELSTAADLSNAGKAAEVASNGIQLGEGLMESFTKHAFANSRHADLGLSIETMASKGLDFVEKNIPLLKAGDNTLIGNINGIQKSFKAFVKDGKVTSLNMYPGVSDRATQGTIINFGNIKW